MESKALKMIKLVLCFSIAFMCIYTTACSNAQPSTKEIFALKDGVTESRYVETFENLSNDLALKMYLPKKENIKTTMFNGSDTISDYRLYYTEVYKAQQTGYRIAFSAKDLTVIDTAKNGDTISYEFLAWNNNRIDGEDYFLIRQPSSIIPSGEGKDEPPRTVDGHDISIKSFTNDKGITIICGTLQENEVTYQYTQQIKGGNIDNADFSIFEEMTENNEKSVLPNSKLLLGKQCDNLKQIVATLSIKAYVIKDTKFLPSNITFDNFYVTYSYKSNYEQTGYLMESENAKFVCYDDTRTLAETIGNSYILSENNRKIEMIKGVKVEIDLETTKTHEIKSYKFDINNYHYYYFIKTAI